MLKLHTIAHMKREDPDGQAGFRKAEEPEFKFSTSTGSSKKQEIPEKTNKQTSIYFCFIDYAKAFDYVHHNKLWKILKHMGIADHLTCLLRNLCADQKATVRTRRGTTDWFQIGKGVHQAVHCHPAHLTYLRSTS